MSCRSVKDVLRETEKTNSTKWKVGIGRPRTVTVRIEQNIERVAELIYSVWPKMSNIAPTYGNSWKHYPQQDSFCYVTKINLGQFRVLDFQ